MRNRTAYVDHSRSEQAARRRWKAVLDCGVVHSDRPQASRKGESGCHRARFVTLP